jgi:ArsR family transcriptional regulator
MEKAQAIAALAALAQDNRLDVFRLLVQAGPDVRHAGLVTVRRAGRSMIYAARFDSMRALLDYLSENCCQGTDPCAPDAFASAKPPRGKTKETV